MVHGRCAIDKSQTTLTYHELSLTLGIRTACSPCGLSHAKSPSSGTLLFLRGGTHLSASLPGSLAASDALGLARLGFEATPVVDADHGKSESHRRRRRGRCCGGGKVQEGAVTLPVLTVRQTVLQHAAEALADKTKELTDVLGSINNAADT